MSRNIVKCNVNKKFFENVFEPGRKSFEKQLGTKLSQNSFTSYLANSGFKFKINVLPIRIRRMR